MRLQDIVDRRARGLLAAATLAVIAASVLLSFNSTASHWPVMTLPDLADTSSVIETAAFTREPAVINFWASWCVACRTEHAALSALGEAVPVYGVNHLDQREEAVRWLDYYGDPFEQSLFDADGRIGGRLGIRALPVSLVIDRHGEIHFRHLGPLDSATVETIIRPLIEDLRQIR